MGGILLSALEAIGPTLSALSVDAAILIDESGPIVWGSVAAAAAVVGGVTITACGHGCGKHHKHVRKKHHHGHHHHHHHHHHHGHHGHGHGHRRSVREPSNFTTIRLYIGSHENHNKEMSGSLPGVVLFDDFGRRIGEYESKSGETIPGGFRDIIIESTIKPSYLHLVAGREGICLAAVAMVLPDGSPHLFTGDVVALCDNFAHTSPSQTVIASGQLEPKKCFWLQSHNTSGISVHLPDFVWNHDRRTTAYTSDARLACAPSPRLFSYKGSAGRTIRDPIYIFNPPLQYEPSTKLDKDPTRIFKWASQKHGSESLSDQDTLPSRHIISGRKLGLAISQTRQNSVHSSFIEEQRIRTQPPRLVISDNEISARVQCSIDAAWQNYDYYSPSEGWYCDMQTRTLAEVCRENVRSVCFNETSLTLQSFGGPLQPSTLNSTAVGGMWNSTGPLFGYQYTDILYAY